jgi:hypothetical protein
MTLDEHIELDVVSASTKQLAVYGVHLLAQAAMITTVIHKIKEELERRQEAGLITPEGL